MMNGGLRAGKFAGESLVPICENVFHFMMLPGVEDFVDIHVVTVIDFFCPFFYIIPLKCNLLMAILQRLISKPSKGTYLELQSIVYTIYQYYCLIS